MNFNLISDTHLRMGVNFSDSFYTATAPVLIIAGDFCEIRQLPQLMGCIERLSKTWETVLYVLGNHEFYNETLSKKTVRKVENAVAHLKNFHVLDNESMILDGVAFIGSTLWSDMSKENPLVETVCKQHISDYYQIFYEHNPEFPILPKDTVKLFKLNLSFLQQELDSVEADRYVVITHHAPSYRSVSPKFAGSAANGAFVSDLEDFILDNQRISYWVHGHCHSEADYSIDGCRVLCHPAGYVRELYADFQDYRPLNVEVL